MKTLMLVMGALLINLLLACDDLAQVQDESEPAATPMSPATPEQPEASGANPSTPRPAPTPEAATLTEEMTVENDLVMDSLTKYVAESYMESYEECIEIAEVRLESRFVFDRLAEANVSSLSDSERADWNDELRRADEYSNRSLYWACAMFWSEPVDAENTEKRNWHLEEDCFRELRLIPPFWGQTDSDNRGEDPGYFMAAFGYSFKLATGLSALMTKPYSDLTDLERAALVEAVFQESQRGWVDMMDSNRCLRYYPQLFTGRWIPLRDPANNEEETEAVTNAGGFLGIYGGQILLCPNERPDWSAMDIEWDWKKSEGEVQCSRDVPNWPDD